jgi:hypothetical protein
MRMKSNPDLSPLHKMQNAVQLAGFHYITCLRAKTGSENSQLEIQGTPYVFEGIRQADSSQLHREFQEWAARAVLRDLIESFSIFLTEVYEIAELGSATMSPSAVKFERLGIEEQADKIKLDFNIDGNWLFMFKGFNRARNCMAHRQGIVGAVDANAGEDLVVSWLTQNGSVRDGLVTQFSRPTGQFSELIRFQQTGAQHTINIQVERTEKRIPIGSALVFEPLDILNICITFQTLASVFGRVGI